MFYNLLNYKFDKSKFFQNYILCLFLQENEFDEDYLVNSNNYNQDITTVQPTSQEIIRE